MATHSSILAWRIPGTGEPGGVPSMGLQTVRQDWVTKLNWVDPLIHASCPLSCRCREASPKDGLACFHSGNSRWAPPRCEVLVSTAGTVSALGEHTRQMRQLLGVSFLCLPPRACFALLAPTRPQEYSLVSGVYMPCFQLTFCTWMWSCS